MKPIATSDQVSETLRSVTVEHRVTLAALSRRLRRPSGYLSRFARGAGPERLPFEEQQLLAQYFRLGPPLFGKRKD
ncbi:MAG: peptidase S24 [Oxalobacteraceae bacterium]|nr:MAG: peptidase S24 [Oxalobacteraceae bacterium]